MKLITITGDTVQVRITKLLKSYERDRKINGNLRLDVEPYLKACIDSMVEKSILVNDDNSQFEVK